MNDISKDPAEFLSNTLFVPEIRAKDKPGVLAELADVVVARGIVPADRRDEVLAALADREEKMATGMQYGVAIPHAKTEVVDRLVTLSPPTDANSHIRFLAVVTRQLANRRVRERVLAATTREELVAASEVPEA